MFMELEFINFTLEKSSRTQMLTKGKKNQLDNDKAMKKLVCLDQK